MEHAIDNLPKYCMSPKQIDMKMGSTMAAIIRAWKAAGKAPNHDNYYLFEPPTSGASGIAFFRSTLRMMTRKEALADLRVGCRSNRA